MRLLLDNNLSPKLVVHLASLYTEVAHVVSEKLDAAEDLQVWKFAKEHQYCLVTKDSDFNDLLASKGFPPKVIWLRIGNCTTATLLQLLQRNHYSIIEFLKDDAVGLLEIL